jgi:hypothetical protein
MASSTTSGHGAWATANARAAPKRIAPRLRMEIFNEPATEVETAMTAPKGA